MNQVEVSNKGAPRLPTACVANLTDDIAVGLLIPRDEYTLRRSRMKCEIRTELMLLAGSIGEKKAGSCWGTHAS